MRGAEDGSNAAELLDEGLFWDSPTGLRFTNFERVLGSQFNDILNVEKLLPGGAPTASEQAQIDAAWNAYYAAMPPGMRVDRSAYIAAKSQLAQSLLATRPYQETLLVEAGDGVDLIQGSDTGVATLDGGAGTDFIRGGAGFSILKGGSGSDWLYADGLESHLDGGADSDLLELADGAFIENAGTDDFVMLGGIRLSGGVQQWWMENGYAYFASATSVD